MGRLVLSLLTAVASITMWLAPVRAEHRVALVIGNANYLHASKLANPKLDATAVADALRDLGFDVFQGTDLTAAGFDRILRLYARAIQTADVALVFYAGHGAQVDGINYLIPVDGQFKTVADLVEHAVSLQKIQEVMERRPRVNLLFFDACRNNPFVAMLSRSAGDAPRHRIGQGWANVSPSRGTYIAFASAEGEVAADGDGGNSPFTTALLKHIGTPGRDVQLMMRDVRQAVIEATRGAQVPWEKSSLVSAFVFGGENAQPEISLTASKTRIRKGEQIQLTVTPQSACRLTLINVDDKGNSCLLFPNARWPDRVIKADERFVFPPPGPKGTLRLHTAGEETFVAMCNASESAISAATRDTRAISCSRGGPDQKHNGKLLEVATFDAEEPTSQAANPVVPIRKQTILRGSVTVSVSDN